MLASARADGELQPARERALGEHLDSCASCSEFAEALRPLGALAASLGREPAPAALAERVRARLGSIEPVRRPRRAAPGWRLAPALAAALAVALVAVLVPVASFRLPAAGAAEALIRLRSLYVEREVSVVRGEQTLQRSRERIWFLAPGFARIERTPVEGPPGAEATLEIRRPGERYLRFDGAAEHLVRVPPSDNPLPEPLTPAVALAGRPTGPGPVIAGRPTTRIVLELDGGTRSEVLVDAQRFTVLGADDAPVLGKESFVSGAEVRRKRTTLVRYNPPVDDRLFKIPEGAPVRDQGFAPARPSELPVQPAAVPDGFSLVESGRAGGGGILLYSKGAMRILVVAGDLVPGLGDLERREPVTFGGRGGTLVVALYRLPRVEFFSGGTKVSVSAPLGRDALLEVAERMFPE